MAIEVSIVIIAAHFFMKVIENHSISSGKLMISKLRSFQTYKRHRL